jgi:hypothetical protein
LLKEKNIKKNISRRENIKSRLKLRCDAQRRSGPPRSKSGKRARQRLRWNANERLQRQKLSGNSLRKSGQLLNDGDMKPRRSVSALRKRKN